MLGLGRQKLVPMLEEKIAALDVDAPDVPGGVAEGDSVNVPSKDAIMQFAMKLLEGKTRKLVRKNFLAAYNGAERKLIEVTGMGTVSGNPEELEEPDVLNPFSDIGGDLLGRQQHGRGPTKRYLM